MRTVIGHLARWIAWQAGGGDGERPSTRPASIVVLSSSPDESRGSRSR